MCTATAMILIIHTLSKWSPGENYQSVSASLSKRETALAWKDDSIRVATLTRIIKEVYVTEVVIEEVYFLERKHETEGTEQSPFEIHKVCLWNSVRREIPSRDSLNEGVFQVIILINGTAIVIGALAGVFYDTLFQSVSRNISCKDLALCVFLVGIKGAIQIPNKLDYDLISGMWGRCRRRASNGGAEYVSFQTGFRRRHPKTKENNLNIGEGFVAAVMIFCVGALATMGSIS